MRGGEEETLQGTGEENQGGSLSQPSAKERTLGRWAAVSTSAAERRMGAEERSLDLLVSDW